MGTEWMSGSRDGISKSPGFDEAMRKVAEDLAAREAANPLSVEERLGRALRSAPDELRSAARMIHDFFRWRAQP